jgi:hypothetical protein
VTLNRLPRKPPMLQAAGAAGGSEVRPPGHRSPASRSGTGVAQEPQPEREAGNADRTVLRVSQVLHGLILEFGR